MFLIVFLLLLIFLSPVNGAIEHKVDIVCANGI